MDLKRCRKLSENRANIHSNASYIKLLDYAERLELRDMQLNATIVSLGTRYKRLLNWIKSLAGHSNHGIPNLSEYECMHKSTVQILKERKELLENEANHVE